MTRAESLALAAATGLAALAITLAAPRAAEPQGKAPALDVTADHLDLDLETKQAVMTGHVKVTRAGLELGCGRLEVRYDQVPHVTWAKGTGGVVAQIRGARAEAPEVELDVAKQTLELLGGVRVSQGEGWMTAERATVQLATGKVSMRDVRGSLPLPSATPEAPPAPKAR